MNPIGALREHIPMLGDLARGDQSASNSSQPPTPKLSEFPVSQRETLMISVM